MFFIYLRSPLLQACVWILVGAGYLSLKSNPPFYMPLIYVVVFFFSCPNLYSNHNTKSRPQPSKLE